MPKNSKYFLLLSVLYVTALLISNTLAIKLITIYGFLVPAGILCFPISYIVNDILVEIYGYRSAKIVIWYGFLALALMSTLYSVAVFIEPANIWQGQNAFKEFFLQVPRITAGSFVAYLIGNYLNARVMSKMKVKSKGKNLWKRTIGSTIIGEGADSIIFNSIAFIGIYDPMSVMTIALTGFVLKTLYEVLMTPLTYWVINKVKKHENIDVYDTDVSYNPFR